MKDIAPDPPVARPEASFALVDFAVFTLRSHLNVPSDQTLRNPSVTRRFQVQYDGNLVSSYTSPKQQHLRRNSPDLMTAATDGSRRR
jgi:hypothetical protein